MSWQALLEFWFGAFANDGFAADSQRKQWFAPDALFDQACLEAFGATLAEVDNGGVDTWLEQPGGRLAYILLCDQLPRNIYRGQAQAFHWDAKALVAARQGVLAQDDRVLNFDERAFFYMPFEHSENLLDQHIAVGLFDSLRDESPKARRELTGGSLRFAKTHRDIIQRFGRFPHRNAALGRTSSALETAFIATGDGFGQNPS